MNNEFVNFKKLEAEYLRLLEIAPQGENRKNLYKSKGVSLEKLGEHILFLEKEITKLKEELSSDGIDVNSYLEKDNSVD